MIRTKKQAVMALSDVDQKFVFWLCDGTTIKNPDELLESLSYMSRETFYYHVNKKKNDFAIWIKDIIRDDKLANNLNKVKTKRETINTLKLRINWLKVKAGLLDKKDAITKKSRKKKRAAKRRTNKKEENINNKDEDREANKEKTLISLL